MKNQGLVLCFASIVLFGCVADDGTGLGVKNPGFEESAKAPKGWKWSQHAGNKAYETGIDSEVFSEGKHSFRVKRISKQVYGHLHQNVPVQTESGKTLHFSAMMRTEKVGKAGWGLVVNFLARGRGNILSQERSERVTGDTEWTRVEIVKPLPENTGKLSAGVMLLDDGTGWIDDVKISIK